MTSSARWRALGVALSLGACASAEPPPPDRLTACELLSRDEVAEVLEGPVNTPTEASGAATDTLAGRSGCAWSRADGSRAVLVELVRTGDMSSSVRRTGFSAAARFDAVATEHPDAGTSDFGGPGERALYIEEAATMHVLAGGSYVTFEVAATPPSVVRPAAEGLARRALVRLRRADRSEQAD